MRMRLTATFSLVAFSLAASGATAQTPENWVEAHNQYRSANECGSAPLTWSPQLAANAQQWAAYLSESGKFAHSKDRSAGENLGQGYSGVGAVIGWVESEKKFYDPVARNCLADGGCGDEFCCGHYTQVISMLSTEVGCALEGDVTVCDYAPHGNMTSGKAFQQICPAHPEPELPFEVGDLAVFDFGGWQCVEITKVDANGAEFKTRDGFGGGSGSLGHFKTIEEAKAQRLNPSECP